MKVVLAEKPSVGRDLARFLGASQSREGYLEGNGYQVTWAYGHLVGLQEPGDYAPELKRWDLATLPFIPADFQLKVIGDKRARQQFSIIRRLFRQASDIICATDAGREGELIFRYILQLSGASSKPVQRLWLSSLTDSAIRQAFRQLRPGREYDRLYAAARCRSEADWTVGLNATRCYTVLHRQQGILFSVGRVQTPVLALLVTRDDEIRTFRPEPFQELITRYRETLFTCDAGRYNDPREAQAALDAVNGKPFRIDDIKTREQRLQPPRLYDLTELQRDMNRRYGLSAANTLQAAQKLYEKKAITYPRTDSRYLTADMHQDVIKTLRKLSSQRQDAIGRLDLGKLPRSRAIFNDSQVSDHHAIIPTGKTLSTSGVEAKVYEAIVTRLIAAFYPPCRKELTTVHGSSNQYRFTAKGVRVLEPGWTMLYPRSKKTAAKDQKAKDDDQPLPAFQRGESGPHSPSLRQGETKPPSHYTENSLLAVMETAGKLVDDEELKEALKERGLGTPATRASIIETLLTRGFIERQGKQLTATDLGRYLIATLQDPQLKSAELTGDWEAKLTGIQKGELEPAAFRQEISAYTHDLVANAQDNSLRTETYGACPRCGKEVIRGKRGYGCSGWREGCGFVLWPNYEDLTLSEMQIRALLQLGRLPEPITIHGSPAILYLTHHGHPLHLPVPAPPVPSSRPRRGKGKRYGGRKGKGRRGGSSSSAASSQESIGDCPLCGKAIRSQRKSFSCEGWQEGCPFTIWKSIAGKTISARTAKTLLSKGKTSRLKGFKSKAGNAFEASLQLTDGKVVLDFGNRSGPTSS